MEVPARSNKRQPKEPKVLSDRMVAWKKRKESSGVAWVEVDSASLKGAIHSIIAQGCAVMFAKARGSNGVMVKVYDEGEPASDFAATSEELTEVLDSLIEAFRSGSEDVYSAMQEPKGSISLAAD